MKHLLANYEGFRNMIGMKTKDKVVEKEAIKRLCDHFIHLWERRKEYDICNQNIADGQIKAYSFIREVLVGRKKKKYGAMKDRSYWIKKAKQEKKKEDAKCLAEINSYPVNGIIINPQDKYNDT